MITFKEFPIPGYPARTRHNIETTDVTIAIAADFSSAGEKLTKRLSKEAGKIYIPVSFSNQKFDRARVRSLISKTMENYGHFPSKEIKLNIAGNGIYSLEQSQEEVDKWTQKFLAYFIGELHLMEAIINIVSVQTGGQTGFDEAGAKAGDSLGIPTTVIAPKGWAFRLRRFAGDIFNEEQFKARFNKQ